MSLIEEQCNKVCRILDDVLANRPTERDSLIVATRSAFTALSAPHWIPVTERFLNKEEKTYWYCRMDAPARTIQGDEQMKPSAQPDIIRCKDCKWYELPSHRITENCVRWMKSNGILLPIKPNDYCSFAERRTDE